MPSFCPHISLGRFTLSASAPIRAFLGVEVEKPDLISRMVNIQREIEASGADLKPVERENLHITMRFLGDIPPHLAEQVVAELQMIDFRPFTASLHGVGVFPKINFPRVIWIGVKKGQGELVQMHRSLEEHLTRLGFHPEREPYTPHITLFRVRSGRGKPQLVEAISQHSDSEIGEFEVRAVQLKRSVLTPRGPIYSNLGEVRR